MPVGKHAVIGYLLNKNLSYRLFTIFGLLCWFKPSAQQLYRGATCREAAIVSGWEETRSRHGQAAREALSSFVRLVIGLQPFVL